jgi:sulfur relay (sulfurtransferase) complex TusBCD TusD component (DsrE family)
LFLKGDSVVSSKKGQSTPEGYYNMEKMLGALIKKGVKVRVSTKGIIIRKSEDISGKPNIL